jgi:hypothetical protein
VFPAHTGVFFLSANPTQLAVWTAAVARCGSDALLSHWSAAVLWKLLPRDAGAPHVTVKRGARRVQGIRVHATTRPPIPTHRSLIPVTTLHRTIDDTARLLTPRGVKSMLRQAEYHHPIDLERLAAEATSRRLKDVLRRYVPGQGKTDSELEADFYELSARAGLPIPLLQRPIPGGRADFVYETLRLIAEVDGYDAHKGRVAYREDRARDRANANRGYETLRFTWEDVEVEPQVVVDDLARAASRRSMVSSTKS